MPEDHYAFPSDRIMQKGMTLRDYFAGQALIGLITQLTNPQAAASLQEIATRKSIKAVDVVAVSAYAYADAMLAAREKGGA